jgi:uncharacterized protein
MEVIKDNLDVYIERRPKPENHQLSLLADICVEPGTKEDWDLLHELHYKADTEGIGPRRWKITLHGETIGVGTMTVPKMLLSGRNELFKYLRPNVNGRDNRLINKYRAEWLNRNVRTNSRLVIDTMYRGAGIAYRAQNLMMRMTGALFIEFQSSMSRFNPFAAKAGIEFAPPKRATNYERGLAFFRRWFESVPTDYVGIKDELDHMPDTIREKCIAEMRKFYYTFSSMEKSGDNRMNGTSRVEALTEERLIKQTQQLVFASPLYGVYRNPDAFACRSAKKEFELPQRIPLLAFDNQQPSEPMNMEKLMGMIETMKGEENVVNR